MTNPQFQGYLENPYLEDNYHAGTGQHSFGSEVNLIINRQKYNGKQVKAVIADATKSLGMEVSTTKANRPKAMGMELITGLFKQSEIGKQVKNVIADVIDNHGIQLEQVLIKDFETGIQVKIIVNSQASMGFEVQAQILDGAQFKGMQAEAVILSQKSNAMEVSRIVKNYLKSEASQFKGYLVDRMDSAGFEVRRDRSFPHLICEGKGYLNEAYLTTPYLTAGYCVHGPMQVELILKKNAPQGMEVNRVIETWTQIGIEVKKVIADKLQAFGMEIERFRSTNLGMQVRFILYNNHNLRVLCDFPSRGTTGSNWTATSTAAGDFSINNVNTDIVEQRWQSVTGTKFVTLVCDSQKTQGIGVDTLAMLNHNLTTSASIVFEGSNASDFSTVGFSKNLTIVRNEDIYYIADTYPTQQFRYWRFIINDPTNPDNYLRIGTIVFGTSIVMQGESFVDTVRKRKIHFSDKVQTEGFTNVSNDRALKRAINIDFQKIAYARGNYKSLVGVFDYSRTSLKCLWIPDPLKPDRFAVFGKLSTMPEETHLNMGEGADYVDFSMEVDESL